MPQTELSAWKTNINGTGSNYSMTIAIVMEILQCCTKSSIYIFNYFRCDSHSHLVAAVLVRVKKINRAKVVLLIKKDWPKLWPQLHWSRLHTKVRYMRERLPAVGCDICKHQHQTSDARDPFHSWFMSSLSESCKKNVCYSHWKWWCNQVTILHMSQQLSCRDMCKIVTLLYH